ncbi:MAG TPA: hypothetical protein VMH23_18430 [Bacteroidota bacterium]|nr:hypothetical protein [Bacteroidota bacterium]
MSGLISAQSFRNIDWKWVGIGYCFFVIFHLLPSYIINGFYMGMDNLGRGIWLFFGLGIIAFYIGYKSKGVTILEPAIAALFYDATLLVEFRDFWGRTISHSLGIIYVWGVLTLVVTIYSAWLGETVQARKKKIAPPGQ